MQRACISVAMVLVCTITAFGNDLIINEKGAESLQQAKLLAEAKFSSQRPVKKQPLVIAGYVENVSLRFCGNNVPVTLKAKLDTGADSSSLHATNIKLDKRKKLVTFTHTDSNGVSHRITCPYVRLTRIKKRPFGYHERPVIRIQMQIGEKIFYANVNLTDRTNFNYKMLVGRKELRQGILIDSSKKHRLVLPSLQ